MGGVSRCKHNFATMRSEFDLMLLLPAVAWASSGTKKKQQLSCAGKGTADDVLRNTDLKMKVAVVTGGDSGLGYATSLALAKRGAIVVIGNRNHEKGLEVIFP